MNKKTEIKVPPDVLIALRETSGYSVEEIAKKLKTSKEKVLSVEEGRAAYSLKQIKKLAEIYKRPLAAFFSSSIPELPKMVDYRVNREKRLTPQVYLAQRRAHYLSEKIKELSGKRSKIPSFPQRLSADELAREFKKTLNIEPIKHQKADKVLAHYKKVLEDNLSVVILEYPLKADDVRAFSIYSELAVIVLNEEDKDSIKLFSLFHEICHLIRKTGGICSLDIEQQNQDEEYYCNRFAAEFLVPCDDLKGEIRKFAQIDDEAITQLTGIYSVSKQVMMIRLLWLGYIGKERYDDFKKKIEEISKQKKYGRRNWEKVFSNRIGHLALQEIKNSYDKGLITFYEASSIIDLKTKYAEKLIVS